MPTDTLEPIATITLTATDSRIEFTNIPQTFKHLKVVMHIASSSQVFNTVFINGDTDLTKQPFALIEGNSGGVITTGGASTAGWITASNSTFGLTELEFLDYTSTSKFKTFQVRNCVYGSSAAAYQATQWETTSAITSISLGPTGSSYLAGSQISIYGIAG